MLEFISDRMNYWAVVILMMLGLHIVFASQNLIKRLVGLSIFQTSVFLFYITLGKVTGGTAPILMGQDIAKYKVQAAESTYAAALNNGGELPALYNVYSNPLPHVLILTAIVVGVATLSVGLALAVRIRETYGTVEMDTIRAIDINTSQAEDADDATEETVNA